MVVDDFDIKCIGLTPAETDPPLIVDANAVLPLALPFQGLQTVSRRGSEIAQFHGAVQLPQFPAGYLLEGGEPQDALAVVKLLGVAAARGPDHTRIV